MKVVLPVFCHTEETINLDLADIEYCCFEKCEVKEFIFYQFNHIKPYKMDVSGKMCTGISSGPNDYVSPLPFKEVEALIDQARIETL